MRRTVCFGGRANDDVGYLVGMARIQRWTRQAPAATLLPKTALPSTDEATRATHRYSVMSYEVLKKRLDAGQVVIIDGGTGTELQRRGVHGSRRLVRSCHAR